MTEVSYRPRKPKAADVPAITSASNAAGEVFKVGDRIHSGDLLPSTGTIDRFWVDKDGITWAYFSPVESETKQWQYGVKKAENLEKA